MLVMKRADHKGGETWKTESLAAMVLSHIGSSLAKDEREAVFVVQCFD